MARTYIIQKNDTISKIAKMMYGDASLYSKLAAYNGIRNPDQIRINQVLLIPSAKELNGTISSPSPGGLATPNGLDEILQTFGNIYNYLREDGTLDPKWEFDQLTSAPIPFSLPLSWDYSISITKIYGHKKLAPLFAQIFTEIQNKDLQKHIKTYGGCFNFRSKRTSGKLSTHAWGIGIDLNPESNMQGTSGDMHPDIIKIFQAHGFTWGGEWTGKTKDPMHFQFCSGY